jgi:uncharacterized protein (TIGR03435 family)
MCLRHLLLCAGLTAGAFAQPAAELPEFEAASVKPNKSGSGHSSSHDTEGQLVATNMSLRDYIRWAFGVKDYQISGPDWLQSERFDIVAKFPPHNGKNEVGPRLQKLLADRFRLAVHRETREFPVYALVPAKNGPKLTAVEDTGSHNTNGSRGHLTGQGINMTRLAEFLSRQMERPVVDLTDLKGVYDITLDWTPDEAAGTVKPGADPKALTDAPPGPDLLTALQQQLGLKLRPQKAPLELIVVDRVERVPVEN